jgi:hypothetical protein
MPNYWITLEVPADNLKDAQDAAEGIADYAEAIIIQVDQTPPQGSTIVGNFEGDDIEATGTRPAIGSRVQITKQPAVDLWPEVGSLGTVEAYVSGNTYVEVRVDGWEGDTHPYDPNEYTVLHGPEDYPEPEGGWCAGCGEGGHTDDDPHA